MFLGGLYWIQLETQPIMMKFTTILLNAEFLRRITKCSRENFKFAVALLYPCNGTVACAPFTLQGSQVRNLHRPPFGGFLYINQRLIGFSSRCS